MVKAQTALAGADISTKEIITLLFVVFAIAGLVALFAKYQAGKALEKIADIPKAINNIISTKDEAITATKGGETTYTEYKEAIGSVPRALINVGEVITPTSILTRATEQGIEYRESLTYDEKRRLQEDYNAVDRIMISGAEGVSRTFLGVSIVDAGRSTGDYLRSKGWFGY